MKIQRKYFIVAVIILGSSGIWYTIILDALVNKQFCFTKIPSNITTYFISLLFAGCIDYFLDKINTLKVNGLLDSSGNLANEFLNTVYYVLGGVGLVTGAILLDVFGLPILSLIVGVLGVLLAYKVWWLANINNQNFTSANASLGGDTNKPLSD